MVKFNLLGWKISVTLLFTQISICSAVVRDKFIIIINIRLDYFFYSDPGPLIYPPRTVRQGTRLLSAYTVDLNLIKFDSTECCSFLMKKNKFAYRLFKLLNTPLWNIFSHCPLIADITSDPRLGRNPIGKR